MVTFFMLNLTSTLIAALLLYYSDFTTANNIGLIKLIKTWIYNRKYKFKEDDIVLSENNSSNAGSKSEDNSNTFESAITIENLYKSYGKQSVLTNLNLKIPKEKISILLGNNGCGKSTLM